MERPVLPDEFMNPALRREALDSEAKEAHYDTHKARIGPQFRVQVTRSD